MTVMQASKIQMRRGPEIDLPGAPSSISPLVFEQGLDIGELGYGTDTGRLFVGFNPSVGSPLYNRITFPYRNVEVLTELSTDALGRHFNVSSREIGAGAYNRSTLQPNTDWAPVMVDRSSVMRAYQFDGATLAAVVELFIFDDDLTPLRNTTMRLLASRNENEALMACSDLVLDAPETEIVDGEATYLDSVEFRAVRAGSLVQPFFRFEYRNFGAEPVTLAFSVRRPDLALDHDADAIRIGDTPQTRLVAQQIQNLEVGSATVANKTVRIRDFLLEVVEALKLAEIGDRSKLTDIFANFEQYQDELGD